MAEENFDDRSANARHKAYLDDIRGVRNEIDEIIGAHVPRYPESSAAERRILGQMKESMLGVVRRIDRLLSEL